MTVLNGGAGVKGQVAYSSIIHVFPIIVGNFYSKIFYVATMSMITFFGPAHVTFGHFDSVPGIYCWGIITLTWIALSKRGLEE